MEIKKVVVIGSGTMGSGIAAHLCNANVPVTLLDLTTDISTKARERIHKSRPPLLIDKSKIDNIKVGNINDDFNVVKEADWIVEAVVERIDIKHQIYKIICDNRKDGGIVSFKDGGIMDLGGKEMDMRTGGFIPIGKKERADDVPARLSKNEFVMTADAVRAAGGGDINKGAKRMYETMNKLEARA